jgi:hypothetical protein
MHMAFAWCLFVLERLKRWKLMKIIKIKNISKSKKLFYTKHTILYSDLPPLWHGNNRGWLNYW